MRGLAKNQSGQTLIELIVSIAVITIGLFSVWFLFLVDFNAEKEAELRIVGANLAREGAEIVKNTRDSNWLRLGNNLADNSNPDGLWLWDRGLADGVYTADYASGLAVVAEGQAGKLAYDTDGYYSANTGGTISPFSRLVTLTSICCQDSNPENLQCDDTNYFLLGGEQTDCPLKVGIDVSSRVTWTYSGQSRQLTVEDQLFNWR